jgi:MSHA pilin protein MshA
MESSLIMKNATQRGFTLIELVVVIIILGILAAFALPRFMNLEQRARQASVRALEGSVRTAAAMAHANYLTQATGPAGALTIEGQPVTFANYYPNAATIANTLQQGTISAGTPGRFAVAVSGTVATFTLVGAPTPASCSVTYNEAAGASVPPIIPIAAITGC